MPPRRRSTLLPACAAPAPASPAPPMPGIFRLVMRLTTSPPRLRGPISPHKPGARAIRAARGGTSRTYPSAHLIPKRSCPIGTPGDRPRPARGRGGAPCVRPVYPHRSSHPHANSLGVPVKSRAPPPSPRALRYHRGRNRGGLRFMRLSARLRGQSRTRQRDGTRRRHAPAYAAPSALRTTAAPADAPPANASTRLGDIWSQPPSFSPLAREPV